nr:E-beta-farnesene synthase [Tanacetum cinerariifolium]
MASSNITLCMYISEYDCVDKMADVNAPSGQALIMAPPVRTDDQILPRIRWVPNRKSNYYLDLEKLQGNQIYKIAVDLSKNTNFFRAFTASSTIPSIYIQQFWDTIQYDKKAGSYRNVSNVVTNDMFQPRRALITIINLCITGKTSGFARPRAPVLQISWGIIKQANIDYAERIWEEFVQSIHTFIENKQNLSRHTTGKKRATLIVIPSIRALITIINLCITGKTSGFARPRAHVLQISWGIIKQANIDYAERIWEEFVQSIHTFIENKRNLRHKFHPRPESLLHLPNEEPVLGYLKFSAKGTKREVFRMPVPCSLITADIQATSYYQEYLANVAKHRRYLAGETGSVQDSPAPKPTKPARKPKSTAPTAPPRPAISTPVTSAQPAPTSTPAKLQEKKRKQATETSDKPPEAKKSRYGTIGKKRSLKSVAASEAEEVLVMEPQELESGKYQPLPEVPGKGKAKMTEEQAGPDPGAQAEGQTGSDASDQDEGQAGSNLDEFSEGQAGPDPGNAGADVHSIPSPMVHAG